MELRLVCGVSKLRILSEGCSSCHDPHFERLPHVFALTGVGNCIMRLYS